MINQEHNMKLARHKMGQASGAFSFCVLTSGCIVGPTVPPLSFPHTPSCRTFQDTERIVHIAFPDDKRLRYLGDGLWRATLRPVNFFTISATPVTDVRWGASTLLERNLDFSAFLMLRALLIGGVLRRVCNDVT